MRLKYLAFALAALSWTLPQAALADPPVVVASIKPVYSLVAGVMAGMGTPVLIVHGAASPHDYSLRAEDARALDAARPVFWVGPGMESFLVKPLQALSGRTEIVEFDRAPGVTTLPARIGGMWEPDLDAPAGSGNVDGHLWLDIDNAKVIVRLAAERLAALDPGNAARYDANARDLESRLGALDQELRADFFPLGGKPFVVFHDAYQYLARRYALDTVGAISVDSVRRPGAGRIEEIRAKIVASHAGCVFGGPQSTPALLNTVTAGTGAHAGTLDDLGTDIPDGPELYFRLMRGVAHALTDCLGS